MENPEITINGNPILVESIPKIRIDTDNYRRLVESRKDSPVIITDIKNEIRNIETPKSIAKSVKKYQTENLPKEDDIKTRTKYLLKFQDLIKKYPDYSDIKNFAEDKSLSISEIEEYYNNFENELNVKSKNLNTYRFYLLIVFIMIHLIIVSLGIKITNYINYQLMFMNIYDELIKEYVQEIKVSETTPYVFDKKTPIEYRFLYFIGINTFLIFGISILQSGFGLSQENGTKIINLTNSIFLTGESPINSLKKKVPTDLLKEVGNLFGFDTLMNIYSSFSKDSMDGEKLKSSI